MDNPIEPYQPFVMPKAKCKNCAKIILTPFLPRYKKNAYCLCKECLNLFKADIEASKNVDRFLFTFNDEFYEEDEQAVKEFLGEQFAYCGTIANFDCDKNIRGVYIIVYTGKEMPRFVYPSPASKIFKGKPKNPSVEIEVLKRKWVSGADIVYIGKAGNSEGQGHTVFKRMKEHIGFWSGQDKRAYGGCIIAQIENYQNLEVWYLQSNNPVKTEKYLRNVKFFSKYGKLPFANWMK